MVGNLIDILWKEGELILFYMKDLKFIGAGTVLPF
jgi:hypothetical protein